MQKDQILLGGESKFLPGKYAFKVNTSASSPQIAYSLFVRNTTVGGGEGIILKEQNLHWKAYDRKKMQDDSQPRINGAGINF